MSSSSASTTAGTTCLVLAPDSWARPLDWLPVLSAYIIAMPPEGDVTLSLDGRSPDIAPSTLRTIVQRACRYLSGGAEFASVGLLEGTVEPAPGSEPAPCPGELVERFELDLPELAEDPRAIAAHARWVKTLVDGIRHDLDQAVFEATPRPAVDGRSLVTVTIATHGAAVSDVARAIRSVLASTHLNVELLVSGDLWRPRVHATVEAIGDARVRYVELEGLPSLPSEPDACRHGADALAINRLLDEARGDFIAQLDHHDCATIQHLPILLEVLRLSGGDFAYGQALGECASGGWAPLVGPEAHGHIVRGPALYSRRLAHMRNDAHAWLFDEPRDWNLWRRMREAGALIHHMPAPLSVRFERSSVGPRAGDAQAQAELMAADIVQTPARELLTVSSPQSGGLGLPARRRTRARPVRTPQRRRLALLDTHFPWRLSGFRLNEARAMLDMVPDMVFFSANATGESWAREVHSLSEFPALAPQLGITDAYCVFVNFAVSLLGLHGHPGVTTCSGISPDLGVARTMRDLGIRFHSTLYPGGGLVTDTDPGLLRCVAARCETVFTNAAEITSAVPEAIQIAGPMATDFYSLRPRPRRESFRIAFAADCKARKGLDTALAALAYLDDRFHLDIAGPNEHLLRGAPPDRITFHGMLEPVQLRDVYWGADAFISPVRPDGRDAPPGDVGMVDGFPTSTAAEALASGCALISGNPRSEHWILRADEHYLEIRPHDPAALAHALVRLERDRDLRDALARRGAARVREVMGVDEVARRKLGAMGFGAQES